MTVSLRDGQLHVLAGTTELIEFRFGPIVPAELGAVAIWVISLDRSTPRTSLLDWIEVNGVPTEGGSGTASEHRDRTVIPMDVTRDVGLVREMSPQVVGKHRTSVLVGQAGW